MEQFLHHIGHLVLVRTPGAGDGLFHLDGRIAVDRQARIGRRQQDDAPGLSHRNGRGHVPVEEQLFHAHEIRFVFRDERRQFLIDLLQPQLRQHILVRKDRPVMDGNQPAPFQAHQSVAADCRTRVDSQCQHVQFPSLMVKKAGPRGKKFPSRPALWSPGMPVRHAPLILHPAGQRSYKRPARRPDR